MTRQDVEAFFQEYVFGFMFSDVEREIRLYRDEGRPAGNFLAALGLLCYTDTLGAILRANSNSYPELESLVAKRKAADRLDAAFQVGQSQKNFDAFFHSMGDGYRALDSMLAGGSGGKGAYAMFRCGMAHEYFAKRSCTIAMLGTALCGIIEDQPGHYRFIVEQYFADFSCASRQLCDLLIGATDGLVPTDQCRRLVRR